MVISAYLLLMACNRKTAPQIAPIPQYLKEADDGTKPWTQADMDLFNSLPDLLQRLKDSGTFVPNVTITIDLGLTQLPKVFFGRDGSINKLRVNDLILRTVPKGTPGKFTDLETGDQYENVMIVKYSLNDASYTFSYWARDGLFKMNSNAVLKFEGVDYPVTAKTDGESILYYRGFEKDTTIIHRSQAEGVRPGKR